ncbi:CTD kinase subunit gamma [Yarrowia sp. C11]|nr:CTD kinase subunit gamma [Yarrowia sp. C11]KAG5364210.1 CTD kinase subunit gamma [Yarrowia sp. E02]
MDPFEARMTMVELVGRLNASHSSESTLASFMMKHDDLKEDLYACIMEILESTAKDNVNMRNNIMWALGFLCMKIEGYESKRKRQIAEGLPVGDSKDMTFYNASLVNDLVKLTTELVCSDDEIGRINKQSVLLFLNKMKKRKLGTAAGKGPQGLEQIERALEILNNRKAPVHDETNLKLPMTNAQKLKRMEEDRERSKMERENAWVVGRVEDEFELQWDTLEGGFTDLDRYETQEENEMCQLAKFGLDLSAAVRYLGQGKRRRVEEPSRKEARV